MTNPKSPAAVIYECPQCGNSLESANAECSRCGYKPPRRSTARWPAAAENAAPRPSRVNQWLSRLNWKRRGQTALYPGAGYDAGAQNRYQPKPFKRPRFIWAGVAVIALLGMAIGTALLFDRDSPDTPAAQRLAESEQAAPAAIPALPVSSPTTPAATVGSIDKAATVQAASAALTQGNLDTARTQIATLSRLHDNDPAAQRLSDRLSKQIQDRDAALVAARACQQSGDTACLLRSASDALANDSSSKEARAMLLTALSAKDGRPSSAASAPAEHEAPNKHHHHSRRHSARYSRSDPNNDVYARH